jgi:triphosphatase
MTTEVEAKFLINQSAQPQQLIEALQSYGAKVTQVPTVDIVDRYFDTPDWKLLQSGWTYRWRDTSGKRKIGLKSTHSANGAVRTREEVEQEVEDFPAHGVGAPAGPVAKRLAKIRQKKLRELFRINNHRQRFHLRTSEGALIEMTLDHARVTSTASDDKAAEDRMQFAELELELIEGPEGALRELAAAIQQRLNLLPARLSKFERSLRPLGLHSPGTMSEEAKRLGESSFLRKLRKRRLKRKNPMVKLAYRCLLKQFEAMLAEEPIAWEGLDIEGVHQMRVATRRLRAALGAFKSVFNSDLRGEFGREFKWLAAVLGNVRDLDVFQRDLSGYIDQLPAEEARCLQENRQHLAEQRTVARKQLIDCLSGDRYQALKSKKLNQIAPLGPTEEPL